MSEESRSFTVVVDKEELHITVRKPSQKELEQADMEEYHGHDTEATCHVDPRLTTGRGRTGWSGHDEFSWASR